MAEETQNDENVVEQVKKPWFRRWWVITIIGLVAIGIIGVAISDDNKPKQVNSAVPKQEFRPNANSPAKTENFTNENFSEALADPDAHKGAKLDLTGRVFGVTETDSVDGSQYFSYPIYTNPKSNQGAVVVTTKQVIDIKKGDYVKFKGTVLRKVKGYVILERNPYDESASRKTDEMSMPAVLATEITKISSSDILGSIAGRPLNEILITDYRPEPMENKKALAERWLTESNLKQQSGMSWQSPDWLANEFDHWLIDRSQFDDAMLDKTFSDFIEWWKTENFESNISNLPFGSSIDYTKQLLGEPSNEQKSEMQGVPVTDYLYFSDWQLVFENGRLRSRNKN